MAGFTLTTTLAQPYAEAVEAVRTALGDQGFGILTEIDLKATLKTKLDVDVAPQIILGACRPALAYEALTIQPSIAAVPLATWLSAPSTSTPRLWRRSTRTP
jgi:uncharacterized protein (DUF302 family)